MTKNLKTRSSVLLSCLLLLTLILSFSSPGTAGNPHSAYYSPANDKVFWFIQTSDTHIGASGSQDTNNLTWLVTQARSIIAPSFIIVTGDLTDSTNGNIFGLPSGPYQAEWNTYKSIVDGRVSSTDYYDLPGNHDAYSDKYFAYYLANSVQGRATGKTQVSFVKGFPFGSYHFLGVNTADNTGKPFGALWPYGDYAGLDQGELDFIGSEMSNNSAADLTMVFGHHPLADTGNSQDTYLYYGLPEFLSLMDQSYSALYGYGHTHAAAEGLFIPDGASHEGFFYFNVASLGKSSSNQYSIIAVDCNGISSRTLTVNTWPAVLITAPVDMNLGGYNPYPYSVPASAGNPIRALVFDSSAVTSVRYRIDAGAQWFDMTQVQGSPSLYEALWNASSLAPGPHRIEVQATSASGTRSDIITASVAGVIETPKIGAAVAETGKYVTTGSRKNTVTTWTATDTFTQGEKVIFRLALKDAGGKPVSGATVQVAITGPSSVTVTSAASNSSGIAEASWPTSAPNKRGTGGTATGNYSAAVSGVTASGFVWDGLPGTAKPFVLRLKY